MKDDMKIDIREVLSQLARVPNEKALYGHPSYKAHGAYLEELTQMHLHDFSLSKNPADRDVQNQGKMGLRLVHWNIERGMQLDAVKEALRHHPYLQKADVLILTETDIGMARSQNRHVPEEIAQYLCMDYLFINFYLNISKGTRKELSAPGENEQGLHGLSILSRFPIVDWTKVTLPNWLDKMRGKEKRIGRKKGLLAMIELPHQKKLAVGGMHLEAHSTPKQRASQMRGFLDGIRDIVRSDIPMVIGGDFNTTTFHTHNKLGFLFNTIYKFMRATRNAVEVDYLYPYTFNEGIFEVARAYGLDYRNYNDLGVGTLPFDYSEQEQRDKVLEKIPSFLMPVLQRMLKPYGGKFSMKVDWFFGKGLNQNPKPKVITDFEKGLPSDHYPIGLDLVV